MTIRHHPGDSLLMTYGAGSLSDGISLIVASHASRCVQCRNRIAEAEMIGGALLDQASPVEMQFRTLNSMMERLDDDDLEEPSSKSDRREIDNEIPSPLFAYLNSPLDDLHWKFMAPGIRHLQISLDSGKNGTVRMVKIAPGISIPSHSHKGMELSLVLRGSYQDETGTFHTYDLSDLDHETTHQPVADERMGCICLIATDAPLLYKSVLGRMLQRFTGI